VDLERLDSTGWKALMSWFSGTSRTNKTNNSSRTGDAKRSRSRRGQESPGQLSLDLDFDLGIDAGSSHH